MPTTTEQIGDILLRSKIVTKAQLADALEINLATGLPISRILVDLGYASDTDIIKRLAKELRLAFIDLGDYEVNPQALAVVPRKLALRHQILPLDFSGDKLLVAMDSPDNLMALDDIKIATGYEIEPAIASQGDLAEAVNEYYKQDQALEETLEDVDFEEDYEQDEGEDLDEHGPMAKFVESVLFGAVHDRASDVLLEPRERILQVRYRIDGVLHEIMTCPKKTQAGVISRLKIMAGMDIAERRLPQDGRFSLVINGKAIDFRAATFPIVYGEQMVLRILEKESIMLALEELGLTVESLERYRSGFMKPYGAVMVTGPTGSGKTTTLYSTLNALNSVEKNIITVEDPVEYRLSGINQVPVKVKAGLTFASALRSILRNDPDTIMIGEIRDQETALIAIESALTGHLVLSTLHTRDAAGALTRLTEMGVEPYLSSSALNCVVAQRLARRLCLKCREEYEPDHAALRKSGLELEDGLKIYRAGKCKSCEQTGYRGRIGLYEVLLVSEKIASLAVEKAPADEITKQAQSEGSLSLKDDGLEKVKAGLTSLEEVLRVAS